MLEPFATSVIALMNFHTFVGVETNDITTVESLQYDLTTIQAATNNFSSENKLGEGGFGDVYKVTKEFMYFI